MKYIALLRGINVGGNSIIKMADLKSLFEKKGFTNVITFIQSGNVVFESDEKNVEKISDLLEKSIVETFNCNSRVVIRSHEEMKKTVAEVPPDWNKTDELRCYVAFIKEPVTAAEVVKEIHLKEGVDEVKIGEGVIYMSTKLNGITKSGFTKLAGTKVYKYLTIRNFNTAKKILALMDK